MSILFNILLSGTLIYIAVNDWRRQKITDRSLVVLLAIGLGATWVEPISVAERILGAVLTAGPLLILSVMRAGAFGGGDIKLAAAAGIVLGYVRGLMSLGISFLVGGIYSAMLLIIGRAKKGSDKFPFGPFICIGIAYCIYFVNS